MTAPWELARDLQKPPPKGHVGSAKTRETAHHGGKDQDKAIK